MLFLVFSGMNLPKSSEPQQSWREFTPVPSSIWDIPSSDSLHSWPSSSSSPTAPTAVRSLIWCWCSLQILFLFMILLWGFFFFQSLLGNTRSPWSATTPFGSSIWSTSADSALHPFAPTTNATTLTDLVNNSTPSPPPSTEMSRTYNPWSMWRPTLSRRSSEPWPSSSDNGN